MASRKTKKRVSYDSNRGHVIRDMPKKRAKWGACAFTVSGVKDGQNFYGEKTSFPVSWRGRDAATRMAARKGFRHAVLALECGGQTITIASCERGSCSVLSGRHSNKRSEHRHRGKVAYNRPIAGTKRRKR